MKLIRSLGLPFVLAAVLLLGGCATMSSHQAPDANLNAVKTIYVVRLAADHRGVNRNLADALSELGYRATTGEAGAVPAEVDAVLTYQDKWMWDITMYLLELNVQLREPKTEIAMATARSYRPSLQRKSPQDMAREVVGELFKKW
jgi:hypothetical protein